MNFFQYHHRNQSINFSQSVLHINNLYKLCISVKSGVKTKHTHTQETKSNLNQYHTRTDTDTDTDTIRKSIHYTSPLFNAYIYISHTS